MKATDPEHLRNIGIAAHIDAGKTTLTERILFYTGKTHRLGEVHTGNTIMDFLEEERERGITITAAATQTEWTWADQTYTVNIIDTPGHVDFTVEVERSMRVLDGLIVLFCGVHGVEPQSETVWRQANRYKVPRMAFVNKLDLAGSDFFDVLEQMKQRLATRPLPLQIPIGEELNFRGLVDLVTQKAYFWDDEGMQETSIPKELEEQAAKYRQQLLETIAEFDEAIFTKFFEAPDAITVEEIRRVIRKATIAHQLVPVFCGSAYKNKGVEPLLNAVCIYLPSPEDIGAVTGQNPNTGEEESRHMGDDDPFAALVFKITLDEQNRKLGFFRVYSGHARRGQVVLNTRSGEKERMANLYQLHGGKRNAVYEIVAGDIAAVNGPKDLRTGDTLCAVEAPIILESIQFPEPVIGMVIEARRTIDIDKLAEALEKLEEEDPSFQVIEDKDTGQTIIRGMGELHLEIIQHRLRDDFKVECNVGVPEVTYKEGMTRVVTQTHDFERSGEGPNLYARLSFEIGPADPAFLNSLEFQSGKTRLQFIDKSPEDSFPKSYLPAIARGFENMMGYGIRAGYELQSMKVRILGGQADSTRSNELAFELCAREGFRAAALQTEPILLEPIMSIEVSTPEENVGTVLSSINRRRGIPKGMENKPGFTLVKATAPLAELFGYAADIRTHTSGRASASLTFSHFAPVPEGQAEKILEKRRGFRLRSA